VTRFDPVAALGSFERDRITVVLGAPAMFSMFLEYTKLKRIKSLNFPALRIIASASAPLHLALKLEVEQLFGLVLHNGYGVTECSPTIAQTRVESPRKDDSVGPIFPGVEVKLVDPAGNSVPAGQVGELRVRGPNVMKGYYRAPDETASAIDPEGWFNTRDLARFEDNNLFIVGRTKELIVRFGLNVYPAEVEVVLNAHPAVVRSAVIGRSVEGSKGDEEIVAFVQALPGSSLSGTALEEHVARHLAPYKRPSQILFIPELPVTPTGKVVKAELAKMIPAS
jgi:acyl-CoA synthetase (AMP-forming)/AMP-acid ligase II